MTSVVLVDDHAGIREGLAVLLGQHDINVIGVAGSVAAGEEAIAFGKPDVAVIDVLLPDGDGSALAATAVERHPGVAVVLYTGRTGQGPWLDKALQSGALGLALKTGPVSELVTAIDRAAKGLSYIDPRLSGLLTTRNGNARRLLSPREREVLQLSATGLTADAIASELFLSVETIRTHTRNAVRKLGARNRLHAVVMSLARGEIEGPET